MPCVLIFSESRKLALSLPENNNNKCTVFANVKIMFMV